MWSWSLEKVRVQGREIASCLPPPPPMSDIFLHCCTGKSDCSVAVGTGFTAYVPLLAPSSPSSSYVMMSVLSLEKWVSLWCGLWAEWQYLVKSKNYYTERKGFSILKNYGGQLLWTIARLFLTGCGEKYRNFMVVLTVEVLWLNVF